MIYNIGYYYIFGKPLIFYFGILTLILFVCTAIVGYLHYKGNFSVPHKWHRWLAYTSITVALIHALMGLAAYLHF